MFKSGLTFLCILSYVYFRVHGANIEDDLFDNSISDEAEGEPLSRVEIVTAEFNRKSGKSSSGETCSTASGFVQTSGVIEGDIRQSAELEENIARQNEAIRKGDGQQNAAILDKTAKWEGWRVPYSVSAKYRDAARRLIAEAIAEVHVHSCIQFEPRTDKDVDYVFFTATGSGCKADVGRFGGRQNVTLASAACFAGSGHILHELMHVLGFFHEQSRYDRDQYLDIQWQNVDPEMDRNFLRYEGFQITVLGTPYDYGSILHYPADAFSVNGDQTIIPLAEGVVIGQRYRLSPIDIYELNIFYECPGHFEVPEVTYMLPDRSEDICGDELFNRTTHECCKDKPIEREKFFCCGDQAWTKDANSTGLDLRHGCCGGAPFFAGLGCCNDILYNKRSHRCCDDRVEWKTAENLDCNGNPYPTFIGSERQNPCGDLVACLKKVSDAHRVCYSELYKYFTLNHNHISECQRQSNTGNRRSSERNAYKYEEVMKCIQQANHSHPDWKCPPMLLPPWDIPEYKRDSATGSHASIKETCTEAEAADMEYIGRCEHLELLCAEASTCWNCYHTSPCSCAETGAFGNEIDKYCLDCEDGAVSQCAAWREQGYCKDKPEHMRLHCRQSCQLDPFCTGNCVKNSQSCDAQAALGACDDNPSYMLTECKGSCNEHCIKKLAEAKEEAKSFCVHEGCGCYDVDNPKCKKLEGYTGHKSTTVNGIRCQVWDTDRPHTSRFHRIGHHNLCRNPSKDSSPWCYTTDPNVEWDYCFLPCLSVKAPCVYSDHECADTNQPSCKLLVGYTGTKNITVRGYPCRFWDSSGNSNFSRLGHHNFCRNPDDDSMPWCLADVEGGNWEKCFHNCAERKPCIPPGLDCADVKQPRCKTKFAYHGTKNVTVDGLPCQFWDADQPQNSSHKKLGHHNFCRNPDKDASPWCYLNTNSTNPNWQVCFKECTEEQLLAAENCGDSCDEGADEGCGEILANKDIVSGEPVGKFHNQPVEACCKLCVETPGCWAFAWNTYVGGTCWLKSNAEVIVDKPGVSVGIRSAYCNAMVSQTVASQTSTSDPPRLSVSQSPSTTNTTRQSVDTVTTSPPATELSTDANTVASSTVTMAGSSTREIMASDDGTMELDDHLNEASHEIHEDGQPTNDCFFTSGSYNLSWWVDNPNSMIHFELSHLWPDAHNFWTGVGFGKQMDNSDLILLHVINDKVSLVDAHGHAYREPVMDIQQDVILEWSKIEGFDEQRIVQAGFYRNLAARGTTSAEDSHAHDSHSESAEHKLHDDTSLTGCVHFQVWLLKSSFSTFASFQFPVSGGQISDGHLQKHTETPLVFRKCHLRDCNTKQHT